MGYNPIEVAQAASQAVEELERSGRVGKKTIVLTELLPTTTIGNFTFDESKGVHSGNVAGEHVDNAETKIIENMTVVNGKGTLPVTLELDGAKINKTAYYSDSDFYGEIVLIGNASMISDTFENTGESFVVAISFGVLVVATTNAGDSHTVRISYETETIHPIDPKFLPGVCLPVVEIADLTAITAEECALLTKCIGSPIVVSANDSKVVCTYAFVDGSYIFTGYMMGGMIASVDGTNWSFIEE